MLTATYSKYILHFKNPSGTSRGILTEKETWFVVIESKNKKGIGECGLLRGLSCDDRPDYEDRLQWACANINLGLEQLWQALIEFPSIQFGLETAFQSLQSETPFMLFPSAFTSKSDKMLINGLVWMGSEPFMKSQIEQKLNDGFSCIKLKIGALDFDVELGLIQFIRQHFSASEIEIRVDANGAFAPNDALEKLKKLAAYDLHSIEQPIAKNQLHDMQILCQKTPLPIALDEELIGLFTPSDKEALLLATKPQYIILKPSFIGGFKGTMQWIELAKKHHIGWWVTSALESNVGLNAIAQWTYLLKNKLPQGLGTGGLYTNNFDCPLEVAQGHLTYNASVNWNCNLV